MKNEKEFSLRIKHFDDYIISNQGNVFSTKRKKPLQLKPQKASQSKKKYLQVRLFSEDTFSKTKFDKFGKPYQVGKLFYLHRLMWENFIGDIPEGLQIDHIDENPRNNNINNLQLITSRENTLKAYRKDGVKYLRKERDAMISAYKEVKTYQNVAKIFNCSVSSVYRIIKNIQFPSKYSKDRHNIIFDKDITDEYATTDRRYLKK